MPNSLTDVPWQTGDERTLPQIEIKCVGEFGDLFGFKHRGGTSQAGLGSDSGKSPTLKHAVLGGDPLSRTMAVRTVQANATGVMAVEAGAMRDVVLGVDSGTQSTKVVAVDLETGATVADGRAPHTGANVQHPSEWWQALVTSIRAIVGPRMRVAGISIAGQQHGCVLLDGSGAVVRPAPLWNNVEAAPDAERLNAAADFARETGSRLVASITIAKLAHLMRTAPADIARAAAVGLPHDWLNLRLTGVLTSDRGDASGSGWWSPAEGRDRRDVLALAVGEANAARLRLPEVRGPDAAAGRLTPEAASALGLPAGIPVGPGTGDNMAAALGIGAEPGEVVISLGTSGTAFAVTDHPTADPSGEVCGFADATGRYLPLACMLNCTRVVDTVAGLVGVSRDDALDRAAAVDPGAGGLLMLPYFEGERTPNLPDATGTVVGLNAATARPDALIRAAVDGVAAGLAYCLDALAVHGVAGPTLTVVGGGAAHPAWRQAIADATGLPVVVRGGGEHAARGAAIQAAAIVLGEPIAVVARRWRPEVVQEAAPRPDTRPAFRLDDRRAMIRASATKEQAPVGQFDAAGGSASSWMR
jgi:xylulokinase